MNPYRFDDRSIRWNRLLDLENLQYSILAVDRDACVADVLFKFPARKATVLHRHKSQVNLLVIQGEHLIYERDGGIKDRRPTGRYTVSRASDEPHREGGGDHEDTVVLFSFRGSDGELVELLDENLASGGVLRFQDLVELQESTLAAA